MPQLRRSTHTTSRLRTAPEVAPPDIVTFIKSPKWLNLTISPYQETIIRAYYGMPLDDRMVGIYKKATGRDRYVMRNYRELTVIAGARSGKDSRIGAPIACYEACFGNHHLRLSPGERAMIPVVAQDARAGQIAFRYIAEYLQKTPACANLIETILTNEIALKNGINIFVFPCTQQSLRGWSIPASINDEVAFFASEGSANADVEIQASIIRGMAQFAEHGTPRLVKISTPYLRDGILYDDFKSGYGVDNPDLLVIKATSQEMNPTVVTDKALATFRRSMAANIFRREFEAEWGEQVDAFLSLAIIETVVMKGRHQIAPNLHAHSYIAAVDTCGGRNDAFTLVICHAEIKDGRLQIVQDVMLGWTPQDKTLNFEAVLNEIAAVCQAFGIKDVIGDDYGAEWPVQAFANVGLNFVKAPDKSVAYQELHKLITQSEIDILDNRTMIRELSLLERTYHKGGRVRIDHPSRGRDDHAVCLALAAQATVQMFSVEAADWGSYEGDVVGNMLDSGW
jgi:hypothetical protein